MKPGIDYIGIGTPFYCHDGNGNFLMHKRSTNTRDEHGTWDFGSGQLKFNEQPHEGVLREVQEEYGCAGIIEKTLTTHSVLRNLDGHNTHWLVIPHIIRINRSEASINEPDMMDEIGWFTLDELPTPLHSAIEGYLPLLMPILKEHIKIKELSF